MREMYPYSHPSRRGWKFHLFIHPSQATGQATQPRRSYQHPFCEKQLRAQTQKSIAPVLVPVPSLRAQSYTSWPPRGTEVAAAGEAAAAWGMKASPRPPAPPSLSQSTHRHRHRRPRHRHHADPKEEPRGDLQIPLQGGRSLRGEGL